MARVFAPEGAPSALAHHSKELADAGMGFSTAVYQHTKLPHRVVEAARYRTAQLNGCLLCQGWRARQDLTPHLAKLGGDATRSFLADGTPVPDEAFYEGVESWRTSPVFDERERLAIEFAERMGLSPKSFEGDESFWSRMHANYADAEIVELTLAIASWIAMGRVVHVLELDEGACPIPQVRELAEATA